MRKRTFSGSIAMFAGLLVAAGCASAERPANVVQPVVGWLHGACIALPKADVRPGSAVAVVELGGPESIVDASIADRARSGETCYPLMDERREVNLASGLTFYRLELREPVELGIGIVRSKAGDKLPLEAVLDIDGDGRRDTFAHCATSEGVRFSTWSGPPYAGDPTWSGYYYLGYDTQANCPSE